MRSLRHFEQQPYRPITPEASTKARTDVRVRPVGRSQRQDGPRRSRAAAFTWFLGVIVAC